MKNPESEIHNILNTVSLETYDALVELITKRGRQEALRSAFEWMKGAGDGTRAVSRSTSVISNLVNDVRRAAAVVFMDEMEWMSSDATDEDVSIAMRQSSRRDRVLR